MEKNFQIKYVNKGVLPQTRQLMVNVCKWCGVCDVSRVLGIGQNALCCF